MGPMHFRTLGNSGTIVSTYALGTMTFGAEADEATSHAILDDYVAAGGNLIDTADVYSSGASEEIIGHWLAAHPTEREQGVAATKGRFSMNLSRSAPNDPGASRRPPARSGGRGGPQPLGAVREPVHVVDQTAGHAGDDRRADTAG